MTTAFIFPGQGSQAVGMGRELAERYEIARNVFTEVDDTLSHALSQTMWEGPKEVLTLTENAQPALMAVSVAAVRVLESEFGVPVSSAAFLAGHSLGEYSALAAGGALSLADAARLLRLRGKAMQSAVPVGEGAMVALLGADVDVARKIAERASGADVLDIANDNDQGQVVLSGAKSACDRVPAIAKEFGVRRAIPLDVSAPFHCRLMQPAADAMAQALSQTLISQPRVPIVANVTARATRDPIEIRDNLIAQVVGTVRWRESVIAMKEAGVTTYAELGSGRVLSGLVRRIDPDCTTGSAGVPDEFETLARLLLGD
ncbi:MAG: ACP S-malonyltransferase [Hyphomicrobiaceae bacterium]